MTSWNEIIEDSERDQIVVAHTERFDGLVDAVGALRNEGLHGSSEWRLMGVMPGIVIEHYCYINGVSWAEFWADKKHIKRLCNSGEFSAFRVAPGEV